MSKQYAISDRELERVLEDCIEMEENIDDYLKSHVFVDDRLTDHAYMVAAFAKLAGQEIPEAPCIPDEKTRILRAKLIMEEALETVRGLGVVFVTNMDSSGVIDIDRLKDGRIVAIPDDFHDPDLIEIVDGCLDLRVVTTGTLVACGIPDIRDLQEMVDVNNIVKFRKDKDGYRREDGKWVKPSDHPKVKVEEFLSIMGYKK